MRILICGVAAIALSGCSWMGQSNQGYGSYGQTNNQYGANNYGTSSTYTTPRQPRALGKLTLSGAIGTDHIIGGDAITGNSAPYIPGANPHQVSMQDSYKKGLRGDIGLGYRMSRSNEFTVRGFYQTAKGKDAVLGVTSTNAAVEGELSAYKGYGIEAGLRHNMRTARVPIFKSVTPYIEGRAGAARLSDINMTNIRVGGTAVGPAAGVPFYEGGWVPTASGLVGFDKPISRHASIGIETGVRYMGGLMGDTSVIPGPVTARVNRGSGRWSIPLQIRGRYRF